MQTVEIGNQFHGKLGLRMFIWNVLNRLLLKAFHCGHIFLLARVLKTKQTACITDIK